MESPTLVDLLKRVQQSEQDRLVFPTVYYNLLEELTQTVLILTAKVTEGGEQHGRTFP